MPYYSNNSGKLYFANCLEVLRKIHRENPKGIFDLVYIDPPFNSKRNYNVLFESIDKADATAQKEAFKDTWSNISYIDTINEIQDLSLDLYEYLKVLDKIRISKSAVSYLTIMAIRLYYIHKVLKETGSFYLHCDTNMSHYLKAICDLIFGHQNFRNEIIWSYKKWSVAKKHFSKNHDNILFYCKNESKIRFNTLLQPRAKSTLKRFGNKKIVSAVDQETRKRIPSQTLEDDSEGVKMADVWTIPILSPVSKERLGYPTQKPETLMKRIIKASSNEGDLVGDFFCGCGTTVAVAQKLNRKWFGVDSSKIAVQLTKKRLLK